MIGPLGEVHPPGPRFWDVHMWGKVHSDVYTPQLVNGSTLHYRLAYTWYGLLL